MYISITPQNLDANYSQSASDFVEYLEKENQGLEGPELEYFFNQYGEEILAEEVAPCCLSNKLKPHNDVPTQKKLILNFVL
jgi:lipopolysaccharide biosynthesis regulator YciM